MTKLSGLSSSLTVYEWNGNFEHLFTRQYIFCYILTEINTFQPKGALVFNGLVKRSGTVQWFR